MEECDAGWWYLSGSVKCGPVIGKAAPGDIFSATDIGMSGPLIGEQTLDSDGARFFFRPRLDDYFDRGKMTISTGAWDLSTDAWDLST